MLGIIGAAWKAALPTTRFFTPLRSVQNDRRETFAEVSSFQVPGLKILLVRETHPTVSAIFP
jgi:hypothetical protein